LSTHFEQSSEPVSIAGEKQTSQANTRFALITTDKLLNITTYNISAEAILGWTAEEVLNRNSSDKLRSIILGSLTTDEIMQCLTEDGYWYGEQIIPTKKGENMQTTASVEVAWDNEGKFNGLVVIIEGNNQDNRLKNTEEIDRISAEIEQAVNERTAELEKANRLLQQEISTCKKAALAARESEGKNRDLVENIKLGIFRSTTGCKGKFLEVNQAMEEITGYSREELLAMDISQLNDPDSITVFSNEVSITDWKVTRELNLKRKDGKIVVVAKTVVAIRFDSGTIQFCDGILEDVTERKQARDQIQQSLERLQRTIKEIIQAMAYIGEVRDPYTAGHQRRVAQLSFEIARTMNIRDDLFEGLTMAAFVHDIGKILVPADILSKPGKLTKPELDMIKDHTQIGYEILKNIEFPWPIATIVLQHHERLDGSGYPRGLKGNEIIIEARILAVADVVEAMSSHRPYRPALGIEKALNEINENKDVLYDSNVVEACTRLFTDEGFSLN